MGNAFENKFDVCHISAHVARSVRNTTNTIAYKRPSVFRSSQISPNSFRHYIDTDVFLVSSFSANCTLVCIYNSTTHGCSALCSVKIASQTLPSKSGNRDSGMVRVNTHICIRAHTPLTTLTLTIFVLYATAKIRSANDNYKDLRRMFNRL